MNIVSKIYKKELLEIFLRIRDFMMDVHISSEKSWHRINRSLNVFQ